MNDPERPRRLESWKEIAAYLSVDVRTAQRYEERDGLPVHRDRRGTRGAVTALAEEIDSWMRARHRAANGVQPEPEGPHVPQPPESGRETPAERPQPAPAFFLITWQRMSGFIIVLLIVLLGIYRAWRPPRAAGSHTPYGVPFVQGTGRFFKRAAAERGRLPTVALEERPGWLAFHPTRHELYVSGLGGRLWVLSTDTWKVSYQLSLGRQVGKLRFSRRGDLAFVANTDNQLVVVDTGARRVADRIDLTGIQARDFVVTPDGQTVYIASPREGILRYDLARKRFVLIPGLVCPSSLWVDPEARLLYVGSRCGGPAGTRGHDAIDIVDLRTGKSLGAISGPPMVAGDIVADPSGTSFWIEGMDACRSEIYDRRDCPFIPGEIFHLFRAADRRFVKAMGWPGGTSHRQPVTHPDGRRAVFLHGEDDFVEVINTATFQTLEKVAVPGASLGAISPDGRHLVISRNNPASLVVLEATPAEVQRLSGDVADYWSGDGTYDDAAGYWKLQPEGPVGFAPGTAGLAFRFDGNGRLKCGPLGFGSASGPKTIAAWVKPDAWSGEPSLLGEPATDAGWRTFLDAGGRLILEAATHPRAVLTSRTVFRAGTWHHFTVVKSGSEFQLYVDGKVESAAPFSAAVPRGQGLVIGGGPGRPAFQGLLDEIVVHSDALPAEAIERLFQSGRM